MVVIHLVGLALGLALVKLVKPPKDLENHLLVATAVGACARTHAFVGLSRDDACAQCGVASASNLPMCTLRTDVSPQESFCLATPGGDAGSARPR